MTSYFGSRGMVAKHNSCAVFPNSIQISSQWGQRFILIPHFIWGNIWYLNKSYASCKEQPMVLVFENVITTSAKTRRYGDAMHLHRTSEITWEYIKQRIPIHGPLTRYAKLRVANAPGMPGMFPRHRLQRKPLVSDPGMHHDTCVTHVPWCMSGSLTRRWQGKRSRHSRRMRNPQFYVSGKRHMIKFKLLPMDLE